MNHENYTPKKKNAEKEYGNLATQREYNKNKSCSNTYENNEPCNCNTNRKTLTFSDRSTHAEEMAIDKIQKNKGRKLIDISLLVIRITPTSTPDSYKLVNSRPCAACVYRIKNMASHGYKISKLYFSNENGDIVCYKLRDIIKEKQFLSRYYRTINTPKIFLREFEISDKRKDVIKNKKSR